MNQVRYLLEQVWLAHKEMGLGPLVQAELWIIAILVAFWLVERVVRLAVRFARRRGSASPAATCETCDGDVKVVGWGKSSPAHPRASILR